MEKQNLTGMIVDNFVMDAKKEKKDLTRIDLSIGEEIKSCFMFSKKSKSDGDLVELKVVNSDNTIEVLNLLFNSNSIKLKKVIATTFEYTGPMEYNELCSKVVKKVDINKYAIDVNGLYVPLNVLLTDYFRARAKSNVVMGSSIEKNITLINEKRVSVLENEKADIQTVVTIDIDVHGKDDKPVNYNEMKVDEFNELSELGDNKIFANIMSGEFDMEEPMIMNTKAAYAKNNEENIKVVENTEEVEQQETQVETNNVDDIVTSVSKSLVELYNKYNSVIDADTMNVIMNIALMVGEEEFSKLENDRSFRMNFNLPKSENDTNNKEDAMKLVDILFTRAQLEECKNDNELLDLVVKEYKITDMAYSSEDKKAICDLVLKSIYDMSEKIEEPEHMEAEIVTEKEVKIHKAFDKKEDIGKEKVVEEKVKEESKDNSKEVTLNKDKEKTKESVYGPLCKEMTKYLFVKGGEKLVRENADMLHFIGTKFENKNLIDVMKSNAAVKNVMCKYTKTEIKENIYKGFDSVENILHILKNRVVGYEDISLIINMPLDMQVKFVNLLLTFDDKDIHNMDDLELAGFYVIFRRFFNIDNAKIELYMKDSSLSIPQCKVTMKHRNIFKDYLPSRYDSRKIG